MTSPIETDIVSAALRVDVVRRRGGGGRPRGKSKSTTTASAPAPTPTSFAAKPNVVERSTRAKSTVSSRSASAAVAKKKSVALVATVAAPPAPPTARESPPTKKVASAPAQRKPTVATNEATTSRVPAVPPGDSTVANTRPTPPPPPPPARSPSDIFRPPSVVAPSPPLPQPSSTSLPPPSASGTNDASRRVVAAAASSPPVNAPQLQLGFDGRVLPPVPLYPSRTTLYVAPDASAPTARPLLSAPFFVSVSSPSPPAALSSPPTAVAPLSSLLPLPPLPLPPPPPLPADPLVAPPLFGAEVKGAELKQSLPLDVRTLMAFRHITPFTPARVHRELQAAQFASVVWRDTLQQQLLLRRWPMAPRTMPALAWRDRTEEGRHAHAVVAHQLAQLDPRNDWSPALSASHLPIVAPFSQPTSVPAWSPLRPSSAVASKGRTFEPKGSHDDDAASVATEVAAAAAAVAVAAAVGGGGGRSTATRRNTGTNRSALLAPPPMPPPFRRETRVAPNAPQAANATGRDRKSAAVKSARPRRAPSAPSGDVRNGGKKKAAKVKPTAVAKQSAAELGDTGTDDDADEARKTSRTEVLSSAPHPIVAALAAESEPTREQWCGVDVARVAQRLDAAGRAHQVTSTTADAAKLVCVALRQHLERVWRGARTAAEARADLHRRDTDTVVRADPRRMLQEARVGEMRRAEQRRIEVVAAAKAARDAVLLHLTPSPPRPVDSSQSGDDASVASHSAFATPRPPRLSSSVSIATSEKKSSKRVRRDSSQGAGVGAAERKRARLERTATSRLSDEHRRALEAEREHEARVARNRSVHAALGVTPTSFAALKRTRFAPAEETADSKRNPPSGDEAGVVIAFPIVAATAVVAPTLVRLAHDADGWGSDDDDSDAESGVPRRPIDRSPPSSLWGRVSEFCEPRHAVEAPSDTGSAATHGGDGVDSGRSATEFPTTERTETGENGGEVVAHVSESAAGAPSEPLSSDASLSSVLAWSQPSPPTAKKLRAPKAWGVLERRDPREFSKRVSELRVTALDLVRYLESDVRFRHSLRLEKARQLLASPSGS